MTKTQELILNRIGVLCREHPQQRLGQIIYYYILKHCPNQNPFHVEDEQLLWIMEQEIAKDI